MHYDTDTFDNLFQWAPIPLRTDPSNFRAFETAFIQEWQPPLNFPFINQFYHPRKGLLRKAPLNQTTQFGMKGLWRSTRWRTTPAKVRQTLQATAFRTRMKSWTLIHDLGSNTRYDAQRFLRSSAAGLNARYALRRLAPHIQEVSRSTALKRLDNCIHFWKGKKAPKAFSFRSPWLLTPDLSRSITRFLTGWYHRHRTLAVPIHKPSVKVIYQKHPAVGEFPFTHKKAISQWASEIPPPCTCELPRRFPEAIIPNTSHIILDASKLTTTFSPVEQALITGSMNNRSSPTRTYVGRSSMTTSILGLNATALQQYQTVRTTNYSMKSGQPTFRWFPWQCRLPLFVMSNTALQDVNFIVRTRRRRLCEFSLPLSIS